jgi:basic membrane protein A and related proteins
MSEPDRAPFSLSRRNLLRFGALGAAALAAPVRGAAAAEEIKVAGVFSTPIEEPWVNQIPVALLKAKTDLGISYTWSEDVKASDFGRVLREYAERGSDLVMGDAFTDEQAARRVARSYPKVAFAMGSGVGPADPNFGVFDNWIHEPAYLSGMIAGKLTKTNTVGAVAAMPLPEVNRLVNAFAAGAKEVNKNAKCKFSFIDSFFDPPKAKEAALAQIEAGVDAVFAERFGVIEAAKEKGIIAFSNMSDQSSLAPDTVVTGPVWDMWPTVQHVVTLVKAKFYTAQDFGGFSYMAKGGSYLAPYHRWDAKLPAEVKQMVAQRSKDIIDGNFRVDVDEAVPQSG